MNDESTKEGKNSLVKTNKERQVFIQKKKIKSNRTSLIDRRRLFLIAKPLKRERHPIHKKVRSCKPQIPNCDLKL
jgi:hypothetical protein